MEAKLSYHRAASAHNTKIGVVELKLSKEEQNKLNKGFEHLATIPARSQDRTSDTITNPEMERRLIIAARKVGFPETEIENVLRHAWCESNWDRFASNGVNNGHFGIMQVAGHHWNNEHVGRKMGFRTRQDFILAMYDIEKNLHASYLLWEHDMRYPSFPKKVRDGWGPWYESLRCRNSRAYRGIGWDKIVSVYRYNEPVTN